MRQATPRVCDLPHYRISSRELANWLDAQPAESWWSVDGDLLLMGQVSIPCPAEKLIAALRRIDGSLFLFDFRDEPAAHGEEVTAADLDSLAYIDRKHGERVFRMGWVGDPDSDWLLCEDRDSYKYAAGIDDEW